MSLAQRPVDPFGLWDAQPAQPESALPGGESLSYGLPGEGADASSEAEAVTPTWTLDLTGESAGAPAALALRSRQVRAIQDGLAQANARAEALLEQRYGPAAAGGVSFALEPEARQAESPGVEPLGGDAIHAEVLRAASRAETSFSALLDDLEQPPPSGALSFGPDEPAAGIPWDELRRKLELLLDSVNRQLLHFAWVDTRLEGRLLARTTLDWAGDMRSDLDPAIRQDQLAAHRRSLELAMASRAATLRTLLTVSQIAAKLAALITTPLGPVQFMALAWEFVQSVIMPALAAAQAETR